MAAGSSCDDIKPPGTVADWYAGRTILVTGGTGFMGKVLLEKLLRSCSDLKRILVLVRPKRGTDPHHRIQQMLLLPVFLHLSTMFCQCEQQEVGEVIYPPPASPYEIIKMVNSMDEQALEDLVPSLLGDHPNIYTYSKRLAETVVHERSGKVPAVVVRPSIVMPAWRDPLPGWVDSLNGPVGILVGLGKGVLRSMMAGENVNAEVIPVDIAINALVTIAWTVGTSKKVADVPVYNLTQGSTVPITWGEIKDKGVRVIAEYPFEGTVWYPDCRIRTNRLLHTLVVLLLHYLPAYCIDLLLLMLGQKRFMVRLQKRISAGMRVLEYFSLRQWNFVNSNFLGLEASLCEEDRVTFHMRIDREVDKDAFIRDIVLGARLYCMKEPLTSLPRARTHVAMLYYVHKATVFALYALLGWLVFHALAWAMTS